MQLQNNGCEQGNKQMQIPEYVSLHQKYECDKCRLYREKCKGRPRKRTDCYKRSWLFSDLFSLITAAVIGCAFIIIFTHVDHILLSLAYTIIFAVGFDIICCGIEWGINKYFSGLEKIRRKMYDKKVADLEAINQAKIAETERQKEMEADVYKDINNAKTLFLSLSKDYSTKMVETSKQTERFSELKELLCNVYEEFLKNTEILLEHIDLDNFYFSEVRALFQIHIPTLKEYVQLYFESVESNNETDIQIKELTKLLQSFSARIIQITNNLKNSDSESLVYKMQALREVISHTKYEEE